MNDIKLSHFCYLVLGSMLILSCQTVRVENPRQAESSKNLLMMNQIKKVNLSTRIIAKPAHPTTRSLYCESDLFQYNPLFQIQNVGMALAFDGGQTVTIAFFDEKRKLQQTGLFKIFQAEDLKLSSNHGNQTVMAESKTTLRVAGKFDAKNIIARLPLAQAKTNLKIQENFATLDFQSSAGDFVAGHQKMNCLFDSEEKK